VIWTNWKGIRILDINMVRKYTWFKDLSSMYYGRELSHVCGYAWELHLTFYGMKILYFCGYWKTILFLWLRATSILVNRETSCTGKTISLSFHAYKSTFKLEAIHVICINLKVRWFWTLNWKQIWEVNKYNLDKLERNKDIRHKHGKKIYMIERFFINLLWKRIISCLWVYGGATLDVL
jgi:hypothetical protein